MVEPSIESDKRGDWEARSLTQTELLRENVELRRQLDRLQCRLGKEAETDGGKRRLAAEELVLHRVREEVWKMEDPDDIEMVLEQIRRGLTELGINFTDLGLNIVHNTRREPLLHTHNIAHSGGGWTPLSERGMRIVGRIWREGKTAYRPDLQTDDPFGELASVTAHFGRPIRAVLDVPIIQGTLAFNCTEPHPFSAEDIAFMEGLAEVLSEGLQRRDDLWELRCQKELLEEKNRLLEAFHRIRQSTLSPLEMDKILDNLAHQVIETGIFRSLMVALVDEQMQTVEVVRNYVCIDESGNVTPGRSQRPSLHVLHRENGRLIVTDTQITGTTYRLDEDNITPEVARTGQMVVVDGWSDKFDDKAGDLDEQRKRTVSYFIPVKLGNRVLAVLATGSTKADKERMLRRIEMMQPLLEQVASALDHARLYRALREERERLAVTLASIGDGVITSDSMGNVLSINEVAREISGWNEAEAIGRKLEEVFTPLKRERGCGNWIEETLSGQRPVELVRPAVLETKEGEELLVESSLAPIKDRAGRVLGVVLVVRDITREHRMEEELHKARRIESLRVMAGVIAHDFNNILSSALVNVSVLKMQTGPESELGQIARDIELAIGHARGLTQQLLSLTRGTVTTKSASSLEELVRSTVGFALRGSNVECDYAVEEGLWPVGVDSAQISQVVQNLVINAVQAMPEGGKIHIDMGNYRVEETDAIPLAEGRYIRCCFRDQGSGIAAEHLDRIFDPFYTTKEQGNGLGLTSAYSIVNDHGGWITVDSRPEQGARFWVYLPVDGVEEA